MHHNCHFFKLKY